MNWVTRDWRRLAVIIGVLAGAMSLPASAQVVNYPEGGPRLVDYSELPDWNGLWERGGDIVWNDAVPPGEQQHAPFNEEYMAALLEERAMAERRALEGRGRQRNGGPGLYGSMPGFMVALRPLEFHINPYATLITSEGGNVRRIYTDGRDHPEHPLPSPMGHSVGHWKDGVLYVDTCCTMEGARLPGGGTHSGAMHVTEKFWSPEPGTLKVEITVVDPEAFTAPWTTVKTYYHRPNWEVVELQGDDGAGRDFPDAAPGDNWIKQAATPTPLSELAESAFDKVEITGPALKDEELNAVTARAVGNTAAEAIEILDVVRSNNAIRWKGKTRSNTWECASALDGTGAFCSAGG